MIGPYHTLGSNIGEARRDADAAFRFANIARQHVVRRKLVAKVPIFFLAAAQGKR